MKITSKLSSYSYTLAKTNKRKDCTSKDGLEPSKHWKFSEADIIKRKYWDQYITAYEEAISLCILHGRHGI
jgi:polyphosphate kinase 2 (PPK2 family)